MSSNEKKHSGADYTTPTDEYSNQPNQKTGDEILQRARQEDQLDKMKSNPNRNPKDKEDQTGSPPASK